MTSFLKVEREASFWTLTLDRPNKMNALSADIVEQLLDALEDARAKGVDLLVFRGEGPTFSAGFDFSHVETQSEADLLLRFVRIEQLLQAVHEYPGLTVGLAHGRVFGAGVDLYGVCKWRCAAPDASFRMPGLKFGLVLGSRRFAQTVGHGVARRILECARPFDAREAHEIGFVDRLAPVAEWRDVVSDACKTLSELNSDNRRLLYRSLDLDSAINADRDMALLVRSAAAPGLKARIAAYLKASSAGLGGKRVQDGKQ